MATLTEQYRNRLALSEKLYAQQHEGKRLDNYKKLYVAKCLDNVNR